jgi:hypothetical protein
MNYFTTLIERLGKWLRSETDPPEASERSATNRGEPIQGPTEQARP